MDYRYATRREFDEARAARWGIGWLSPTERRTYAELRDARRRMTFLLGRLLAKRLILSACRAMVPSALSATTMIHPVDVDVDSGLAHGRRRRPRVNILGRTLPWSLSIAHTDRAVLVALAWEPGVCVGVDLVEPASLVPGFAQLWFTAAERRQLQDRGQQFAAELWAIKEAVYKAAENEHPFAPRSIEVLRDSVGGYVSRPACALQVWQTSQNETAVIAVQQDNLAKGHPS